MSLLDQPKTFMGWKNCGPREYKVMVQNHPEALEYLKESEFENMSIEKDTKFSTYFSDIDSVEIFLEDLRGKFEFEDGTFTTY